MTNTDTSMKQETSTSSPKAKHPISTNSNRLTPSEINSLRKDLKDTIREAQEIMERKLEGDNFPDTGGRSAK